MNKKWIALSLFLVLIAGCVAFQPKEEREKVYGKAVPVITQSFASKELIPGDTWKVYLNASDPDGDMKDFLTTISQPGVGIYPIGITRIKEENRKELSGYIYLSSLNFSATPNSLNFVNLTLTVQIEDKAGHLSAPVSFPLSYNVRAREEKPSNGVFKEKDLGPILINLRSIGDGRGGIED